MIIHALTNTMNIGQFCDDPKNMHIISKNIHFSDPPPQKKKNEIQNLEAEKMNPSLHMFENVRVPPTPLGGDRLRYDLNDTQPNLWVREVGFMFCDLHNSLPSSGDITSTKLP